MKCHADGQSAPAGSVFVFGSNLAGRHGAGAAKHAAQHFGAEYGVATGRTGDSYAIPTKGSRLEVLAIFEIYNYVCRFVRYTKLHAGTSFFLTRVGCGLAGYSDQQIAPMFIGVGENVDIPEAWKQYLE